MKVLDPQDPLLHKWNKIFIVCCVISLFLDPLFFYAPVVDAKNLCLSLDKKLEISVCVLRTFFDIFYVLHIVLEFLTGFVAPSSRVFGRSEIIDNGRAICLRYLYSYFILDILSILPLPQVTVMTIVNAPISLATKDLLKMLIFAQFFTRILRIYPLYKAVNRSSRRFSRTAWPAAVYNLLQCILASHVFGALWYVIAIERKERCWRMACGDHNGCKLEDLYCGVGRGDTSFLNSSCPLLEPDQIMSPADFDFGMFLHALKSHVVEQTDFTRKFFNCFWWGWRNLSSLGQNLNTSNSVGEIIFALLMSVTGLVLVASVISSSIQQFVQSITGRLEEVRMKRQDIEQWMSQRMLPEGLRARIRQYEQYKWQQKRGVEEESLISNFPKDLRRDIKRHLCWNLLTRVPLFERVDEQLLDVMYSRLKPVLYVENSYIFRQGDPVDEMLFIMKGSILSMSTNGGTTGFFNSFHLTAGDFCGEELLTWALEDNSSSSLPVSTRTVRAYRDVDCFCLTPDDLKYVMSQFKRVHGKQLQHTYRYYSQQWRTWGACFIQAAWRRHYRRKIEKTLREAEDRLQNALAKEGSGSLPSLAATVYASRFATNMLGNLRRNHPRNTFHLQNYHLYCFTSQLSLILVQKILHKAR
ncbi:LOW QUALITY PROTEIN: cyclic nucleotide-gated ion channel 1-like [Sesamum indicum]|uniref:LOW QUALITY PROTEIN: cyclic nucleotide-gated ion channel 1-like n=1 Tax=Sesamum indicum TaxID=4182 RepID=A0A6I9UFN1_SESIN|nr:LOW QUALITY PROTEIN: cyclic nucleotide-gated ion channel 1-like [Sesamum indicum]